MDVKRKVKDEKNINWVRGALARKLLVVIGAGMSDFRLKGVSLAQNLGLLKFKIRFQYIFEKLIPDLSHLVSIWPTFFFYYSPIPELMTKTWALVHEKAVEQMTYDLWTYSTLTSREVRFGLQLGQIGRKWDKSDTGEVLSRALTRLLTCKEAVKHTTYYM